MKRTGTPFWRIFTLIIIVAMVGITGSGCAHKGENLDEIDASDFIGIEKVIQDPDRYDGTIQTVVGTYWSFKHSGSYIAPDKKAFFEEIGVVGVRRVFDLDG